MDMRRELKVMQQKVTFHSHLIINYVYVRGRRYVYGSSS